MNAGRSGVPFAIVRPMLLLYSLFLFACPNGERDVLANSDFVGFLDGYVPHNRAAAVEHIENDTYAVAYISDSADPAITALVYRTDYDGVSARGTLGRILDEPSRLRGIGPVPDSNGANWAWFTWDYEGDRGRSVAWVRINVNRDESMHYPVNATGQYPSGALGEIEIGSAGNWEPAVLITYVRNDNSVVGRFLDADGGFINERELYTMPPGSVQVDGTETVYNPDRREWRVFWSETVYIECIRVFSRSVTYHSEGEIVNSFNCEVIGCSIEDPPPYPNDTYNISNTPKAITRGPCEMWEVAYDPMPRNETGNYYGVHYGAGFWLDPDGEMIPAEPDGSYGELRPSPDAFTAPSADVSQHPYVHLGNRELPWPDDEDYMCLWDIDDDGTHRRDGVISAANDLTVNRSLRGVDVATGPTTEFALYGNRSDTNLYMSWKPHEPWWPWASR